MTTRDDDFGRKISGYLDQGTASMRAGTAYRLQLARQQALERLGAPERATTPQLAGAAAGGTGSVRTSSGGRSFWANGKLWLGIALIVAATAGYQGYQTWQAQRTNDLVEQDAEILTSDLPIDAYLDGGFQNWLKHLDDN
jgi:hypothetical protein